MDRIKKEGDVNGLDFEQAYWCAEVNYFPFPFTTKSHLDDLYEKHGVDRAVKIDLASLSENPETVREEYTCGLLTLMVKDREEGLLFGLEFCHLCLMKRNNRSPRTFLVSPRPGRQIVDGIPYRDEKWREHFVIFEVSQASVGNLYFSKLPREWAEDIG
ncbi:hypothetical protein DY000_02024597 [Brassica cretica]|uniref:Uncharacterized protein n=1 Tax=Brassica cretica TaxID=69181 RepID=A0ABQ7E2B9_BRACR|nr:hypothetical protein DY000_02024597 [Brassica cretica]